MSYTEQVEVLEPDVVHSIVKAETDVQVETAKRFPRDIVKAAERCRQMATRDDATADSCIYALPVAGGGVQEGPSVRLAEIMVNQWGNLRAQARIVDEGPTFVTAQAAIWDIETNVAVSIETKRRIVDKYGKRYKTNVIQSTMNAARSIAFRDAAFKAIPKSVWGPIYDECKAMITGDASSLARRRTECVKQFAKMGVFEDQLLTVVECGCIDELTGEQLNLLRGLFKAIRDGETTIDEVFPEQAKAGDIPATPVEKAKAAAAAVKKDQAAPKPDAAAYKLIHEAAMALTTEVRATVLDQFGLKLVTEAKKLDVETANDLLVALQDAAPHAE